MSCNYCNRVFSIFRLEKCCPSCGFSYCVRCLNNTILVKTLNVEKKVCIKCSQYNSSGEVHMIPPPDYYRNTQKKTRKSNSCQNSYGKKDIKPRLGIRCANISNRHRAAPDENSPSTSNGYPKTDDGPETVSNTEPTQEQGDLPEESDDKNDRDVLAVRKRFGVPVANPPHHPNIGRVEKKSTEQILRDAIKQLKGELQGREPLPKKPPTCLVCRANDVVVNCKGCKCIFCMKCFYMHSDDVCVEYETLEPHAN